MTEKKFSMGFIEKLEILINHYLTVLGGLFARVLAKITPPFLKKIYFKVTAFFSFIVQFVLTLPTKMKSFGILGFKTSKEKLKAYPVKEKISEWQKAIQEEAKKRTGNGFFNKLTRPFILIALFFKNWTDSLSPVQIVLLIIFTAASFFSSFIVFESSKKIALLEEGASRFPASIDEEKLKRPVYYKKQTRDFEIMAIKIPVYFADTNEYRSVMADLSIVMTNRSSKNYLAAHEQILRDHLIMNIEPTIAAFNLQTEGKEIIREKIKEEVSQFLVLHNIEGAVEEVKIIYLLAN
jgi:flagellar basal body-associated protein FliL